MCIGISPKGSVCSAISPLSYHKSKLWVGGLRQQTTSSGSIPENLNLFVGFYKLQYYKSKYSINTQCNYLRHHMEFRVITETKVTKYNTTDFTLLVNAVHEK